MKSKQKKISEVIANLSSIFEETEQNKLKTEDFTCSFCEQSENTSLDTKYTQYPSANWRTLTFAGKL